MGSCVALQESEPSLVLNDLSASLVVESTPVAAAEALSEAGGRRVSQRHDGPTNRRARSLTASSRGRDVYAACSGATA
jgi:hypothetical protein